MFVYIVVCSVSFSNSSPHPPKVMQNGQDKKEKDTILLFFMSVSIRGQSIPFFLMCSNIASAQVVDKNRLSFSLHLQETITYLT